MYIVDTIKVKLNRQHKTKTSWLVKKIKAILNTPIQKLEKPIFSFKITNKEAVRNSKIRSAFNGESGVAIAATKGVPLN